MRTLDLSIVVPLFNEEKSLVPLSEWIDRVLLEEQLSYELIFIDDGSRDRSWEVIVDLHRRYGARIRAFSFVSNYGKSAALQLGFQKARAAVVITMDADLQDSPDEMLKLYKKVTNEGYDLVSGWKHDRRDPFVKRWTSKFFNLVTRLVSGIRLHDFNCGLKAYKLEAVRSLELQGAMHRYIPLLVKWKGFIKISEQAVRHHPRRFGKTKYGLSRFMHGFLDLLSVSFVSRFMHKPMHFFGFWGSLSFLFGIGVTTYLVVRKLYLLSYELPARDVTDQPLFYLALLSVTVGMQLFLTGFLAEIMVLRNYKQDFLVCKQLPCDTVS